MRFAILGYPIQHSLSPRIFQTLKKMYALPLTYEILEIEPALFLKQQDILAEFDGFNVTFPYKQKILEYVTQKTADVQILNAANVIQNGEHPTAYNTDVIGFRKTIEALKLSAHTKTVVLGAGGAARAVVLALQQLQFTNVFIFARNPNQIQAFAGVTAIQTSSDLKACPAQMVIQTTPIGMGDRFDENDLHFFDLSWNTLQIAYDLIYHPRDTVFMKLARKNRVPKILNGLDMLIYQAIAAFEICTGVKVDVGLAKKLILKDLETL